MTAKFFKSHGLIEFKEKCKFKLTICNDASSPILFALKAGRPLPERQAGKTGDRSDLNPRVELILQRVCSLTRRKADIHQI